MGWFILGCLCGGWMGYILGVAFTQSFSVTIKSEECVNNRHSACPGHASVTMRCGCICHDTATT